MNKSKQRVKSLLKEYTTRYNVDFRYKVNPNLSALLHQSTKRNKPVELPYFEHKHIFELHTNKQREFTSKVICQICSYTRFVDSLKEAREYTNSNLNPLFPSWFEYCKQNNIDTLKKTYTYSIY